MESSIYDILDPPEIKIAGIKLYPPTLGHYFLIRKHKLDRFPDNNIRKIILCIRICSQRSFEEAKIVLRKCKNNLWWKFKNAFLAFRFTWKPDKKLRQWSTYKMLLNSPAVFEPVEMKTRVSPVALTRNLLIQLGYSPETVMDTPLVIATEDVAIFKELERGPSVSEQEHIKNVWKEAAKISKKIEREKNVGS